MTKKSGKSFGKRIGGWIFRITFSLQRIPTRKGLKIKFSGKLVREMREKMGLSGRDLAEITGISRPYLWQIEDGRSTPSLTYARKIAAVLGVDIESLFE